MSIIEAVGKKVEEIQEAADTMLPIEDLHLGQDLRRMAEEIDKAQEVMFGLPPSDKERIRDMMRLYVESDSRPVVFCAPNHKVLFLNEAAIRKYGSELLGKEDAFQAENLAELRDARGILMGYLVKE